MHEGPTENRLGELGSLYKYYYYYYYYYYYRNIRSFSKRKETVAQMPPAIVSGIVTGDALVSF